MPRAKREANYIGAWWRNHRPEARLHFDEDFAQLVGSLGEHPERGFLRLRGVRALVTARTRHIVFYRVRPRSRRVEIIAVRAS